MYDFSSRIAAGAKFPSGVLGFNRLTRPFSYAICPCQNAQNAPFIERSFRLFYRHR